MLTKSDFEMQWGTCAWLMEAAKGGSACEEKNWTAPLELYILALLCGAMTL